MKKTSNSTNNKPLWGEKKNLIFKLIIILIFLLIVRLLTQVLLKKIYINSQKTRINWLEILHLSMFSRRKSLDKSVRLKKIKKFNYFKKKNFKKVSIKFRMFEKR